MNRSRFFNLCFVLALLSGLLTGCGGTQGAPDPPNKEEVHSEAYEKIRSILKDSEFYYLDETEALAPYYEMAEERKEAILNSPTEIVKSDEFIPGETYTGTAYYVSPNGNNDNNGLSPETAWQTVGRIGWGDVQEGDAVFFERGEIYRLTEHSLDAVSNVTYSAYGEGAKPIITLAQENSARAACWELWHEGVNGEKSGGTINSWVTLVGLYSMTSLTQSVYWSGRRRRAGWHWICLKWIPLTESVRKATHIAYGTW